MGFLNFIFGSDDGDTRTDEEIVETINENAKEQSQKNMRTGIWQRTDGK